MIGIVSAAVTPCRIARGRVGRGPFPPEVALHLVRRACELPEQAGRSLSQWDCTELARQLVIDEVVAAISPQTVQRMLAARRLKPWRSHVWLHPRTPRDAAFAEHVRAVADVLTRPLAEHEAILSLDEMTSLQPRPRRAPTRPAQPGRPVQVEHEYARAGATHLFAAFDTRTGRVYGLTVRRKRQVEYLTLLEHLDRAIPASVTAIHLLADNVSVHHGTLVRQWLADHPRFVAHFTPVHCSWMNPVEQWFGILRRKRLRSPNFADLAALQRAILQFIAEWNEIAHPFRWTTHSFEKILTKIEDTLAADVPLLAQAA
ncbi:MAG: IS630 family transposase [Pyrinomonadaceae bacterium]|nr:IS630 family transposase [Pyrinomonadaceae bacterium]